MTSLPREMTCGVCGARSTQTLVLSASAFGASDLDTRPPEMLRSALRHQAQECPSCGYCAEDLSAAAPGLFTLVSSPEYVAQRQDSAFPGLANRFLCCALIHEAKEQYALAGWSAIRATWACDDEDNDPGARICRAKTLGLFAEALRRRQPIAVSPTVGTAIRLDLLRRSGQMERVLEIARLGVPTIPGEDPGEHRLLSAVFDCERALAQRGDRGGYTLEDAFRSSGGEGGRLDSV